MVDNSGLPTNDSYINSIPVSIDLPDNQDSVVSRQDNKKKA